jgi:hypothetical protein
MAEVESPAGKDGLITWIPKLKELNGVKLNNGFSLFLGTNPKRNGVSYQKSLWAVQTTL